MPGVQKVALATLEPLSRSVEACEAIVRVDGVVSDDYFQKENLKIQKKKKFEISEGVIGRYVGACSR